MGNTKSALLSILDDLDESMGSRKPTNEPKLSPVARPKDEGRLPLRKFGTLEVERIMTDPNQPRVNFDEEELRQLATSLQAHGQLHPIRVRWDQVLERWILVTGERRWRAAQLAGMATIDCFFVEGEISEAELREQQLVENLLRKDLKPLEEANAYADLMQLHGWNGKQVAAALRISTSRVSRALALLDLPASVQQQVDAGTLAKSSAYEISKLPSSEIQELLVTDTPGEKVTHAKTVAQVKQRRGRKTRKPSQALALSFVAENGLAVKVAFKEKVNYHYVEQALVEALEEVRLRIQNNVKIF